MSNFDSSYQRRKRDIERVLVEVEKVRRDAGSSEEALAIIVKSVSSIPGGLDVLRDAYRQVVMENRTDVSSAIEKALIRPPDSGSVLSTHGGHLTSGAGTWTPPAPQPTDVQKAHEQRRDARIERVKKDARKVHNDIHGIREES